MLNFLETIARMLVEIQKLLGTYFRMDTHISNLRFRPELQGRECHPRYAAEGLKFCLETSSCVFEGFRLNKTIV